MKFKIELIFENIYFIYLLSGEVFITNLLLLNTFVFQNVFSNIFQKLVKNLKSI